MNRFTQEELDELAWKLNHTAQVARLHVPRRVIHARRIRFKQHHTALLGVGNWQYCQYGNGRKQSVCNVWLKFCQLGRYSGRQAVTIHALFPPFQIISAIWFFGIFLIVLLLQQRFDRRFQRRWRQFRSQSDQAFHTGLAYFLLSSWPVCG